MLFEVLAQDRVQWTLGAAGQSCADACAALDAECAEDVVQDVDRVAFMAAVAAAGSECTDDTRPHFAPHHPAFESGRCLGTRGVRRAQPSASPKLKLSSAVGPG